MTISWITPQGRIATVYETEELPNGVSVKFKADGEFTSKILSNGLPSEFSVNTPISLGDGTYEFRITGTAPSVKVNEEYYICFRLIQDDAIYDATYSILVENKSLKWDDSQSSSLETSIFTDTKIVLRLLNANGNEQIMKVNGTLPPGLNLGFDGTLFGTVKDQDMLDKSFSFTVSVFINGVEQPNLEKEFTIKIIPADPYEKPKWVSNAGLLGTLKSGQRSELLILASNSTVSQQLYYELKQSNLPDGITMDALGHLNGTCATNYTQNWYFTAVCYKIVNGTRVESEPREFYILTNPSSRDDAIEWDLEDDVFNFGTVAIGEKFNGVLKAYTESGLEVTFSLVGDSAPKGISLTKDGLLYGVVEPQKTGVYTFTVQASAGSNKSLKDCSVELKRGLGQYAMTLSLVLWLKYQDEYTEIKSKFTIDEKYQPKNPNYIISGTPKIDVAYIKTYDKEILPLLLDSGQPEWVRFHKTTSKEQIILDTKNEVQNNYEVFYKPIDEYTYQWDKLKNGNYDFEANNGTGGVLEWNDFTYDTEGVKLPPADNPPTPTNQFGITNILNMRTRLTEKVFVEKLQGTYFYFKTDQSIAENVDEITMTAVRDGVEEEVIKIENPYVFRDALNPSLQAGRDFITPFVGDVVEDPDSEQTWFTFLDYTTEPLPYWKRKQAKIWEQETKYYRGDVLNYLNRFYYVEKDFVSTFVFADNLAFVSFIDSSELDRYLPKTYFATLDIGYYNPRVNMVNLQDVNSAESNGAYYTNKIYVFSEMAAIPYFDDSFGTTMIKFYSSQWKNYPKDGILNQ